MEKQIKKKKEQEKENKQTNKKRKKRAKKDGNNTDKGKQCLALHGDSHVGMKELVLNCAGFQRLVTQHWYRGISILFEHIHSPLCTLLFLPTILG
jgi:hypothetical protein